MVEHEAAGPTLRSKIEDIMARKGLRTRDVVKRVPQRQLGTAYRIIGGTTTDPWTSTVVELCHALDVDPDTLLDTEPRPLEKELEELFAQAHEVPEEDRWIIVDVIWTLRRRQERAEPR